MRMQLIRLIAVFLFAMPVVAIELSEANAQSASSSISQSKLEQIFKWLHTNDHVNRVHEQFASALGLPIPYFRKAGSITRGGMVHGISVGISKPERLILHVRTRDKLLLIYVATLEAKLVSAATQDADGVIRPLSIEAAQAGFDVELRVWDAAEVPN